MAICFQCGKRLADAMGRTVAGVERDYHGNPVKLHKSCAKTFDANKTPTARAATTEDGYVYADEGRHNPFRTVFKRQGELP